MDDLKRQIGTTLFTTKKAFKLGEVRVLAALFLPMMAPEGARPGSLLQLQAKDLEILLARDPDDPDGYPRLVILLTLEKTKYTWGRRLREFALREASSSVLINTALPMFADNMWPSDFISRLTTLQKPL